MSGGNEIGSCGHHHVALATLGSSIPALLLTNGVARSRCSRGGLTTGVCSVMQLAGWLQIACRVDHSRKDRYLTPQIVFSQGRSWAPNEAPKAASDNTGVWVAGNVSRAAGQFEYVKMLAQGYTLAGSWTLNLPACRAGLQQRKLVFHLFDTNVDDLDDLDEGRGASREL